LLVPLSYAYHKITLIKCKDSFHTSQRTQCASIKRNKELMLNLEIIVLLFHPPKKRRWSDVSQMLSGQAVDPASLL